jgi:hypothetical protein
VTPHITGLGKGETQPRDELTGQVVAVSIQVRLTPQDFELLTSARLFEGMGIFEQLEKITFSAGC